MVALAAIALLVVVWWSPNVLRPSLGSAGINGWSGSSTATVDTPVPAVLAQSPMVADGWRSVEIVEVEAVSGAQVAGAWVVPIPGSPGDGMFEAQSEQFTSTLDFARHVFDVAGIDEAMPLPRRVDVGEPFHLVVLWEVTDCAALDRTFSSEVSVRLSMLPGLDRSVPVGILTPDHDTLVRLGGC